jgi:DNA end-binding protein Ku
MDAIWTGAIRFGLIYIPVRMYKGSQSDLLDLHYITRNEHHRIRFRKVSEATGEEINWVDIVRGFEYEKGRYIPLEEEDFRKANVRKTRLLDVVSFIETQQVEFKYLSKPFYLEPDQDAEEAYALLREAMIQSGKVALVRYVLKTREHLGLLQPEGRSILLMQMRFQSELIGPSELDLPKKDAVSGKDIRMAVKLIDLLSEPWNLEKYHDTYIEDIKRFIERKVEGKTPLAEEEELIYEMKDLFESLSASIDQVKAESSQK